MIFSCRFGYGKIGYWLFFGYWCLVIGCSPLYAQKAKPAEEQSDQQINDFSLVGYGDKGKKAWDLSGKSADIFDEIVKLKSVIGNLYGKEENVNLCADRGDFNKVNGKIHLEKNVVITTTSGTKLTTDSLDWDKRNQLVTTKDKVNIKRGNMITIGTGAVGQMGLKQVTLQKDVTVDILPQAKDDKPADPNDKTMITCDGPLEINYEKNIAEFYNNVKVERPDSTIYSDRMDIYFLTSGQAAPKETEKEKGNSLFMGSKIDKIICRGHVKVLRGENISYSEEAIYSATNKTLVLTGRPKLIIYSTEGFNASLGN